MIIVIFYFCGDFKYVGYIKVIVYKIIDVN